MQNVILVVHILAGLVMTGLVLMQKSEGGALGIGGGGGGLMGGRGAASALVRTTIIFGAIFFVTSLTLTTIASRSEEGRRSISERALEAEQGEEGTNGPVDLLDPNAEIDLPGEASSGVPVIVDPTVEQPVDTAPADPAPEAQPEDEPDTDAPQ